MNRTNIEEMLKDMKDHFNKLGGGSNYYIDEYSLDELNEWLTEKLISLLAEDEGEVKDFRQYCLDNIGFVIERGFDTDIDGHQEPWFSLEYPVIENEDEKEGREPSNEELALFYLAEELFNASQPQKGEGV